MKHSRRIIRVLSIVLVTSIALVLRLRAVEMLPIDYDEDDYLRAGQQYAASIQAGDWAGLTRDNYRSEHPPLPKLAYGFALSLLSPAPEVPDLPTTAPPAKSLPQPHLTVARLTSVAFGVLEVMALAILNPLAGLFLAIRTWDIKYTSQVMLEALPSLMSALAVVFYLKSRRQSKTWLALSAVALGLTAASKYVYGVAGLVIVGDWLWHTRPTGSLWSGRALPLRFASGTFVRWLRPIVLWGTISVAVFFMASPYLWPDPINRLKESVFYHFGYAQSDAVKQAGFPTWQPFVWLAESVPWSFEVFVFPLDFFISIMAILGVRRMWTRSRVIALWLIVALGFLLAWTTKWPQYTLILTFPLSLVAAEGFFAWLWEPLTDGLRRLRSAGRKPAASPDPIPTWRETRRALPWLIPGLIVLAVITLFPLFFQIAMSLTDLSARSLKDGINGGVWRAVGEGVTGQVEPVTVDPFAVVRTAGQKPVNYAGPSLLLRLFSGGLGDAVVFDVLWTIVSVGLQTALGLGVAMLLHQRGVRFRGWWRALFILPWAIPEFVGALIWARVFEPTTGTLSILCGCPLELDQNPQAQLSTLLIGATWIGWPLIMLAAAAGLKMIPPDVYDAAAIDGAGRFSRFRSITWPLLLPLLVPAIIIRSIFAFNQFYLFVVMQSPYPLFTLATLSYYIFDISSGGQFAVSAAINVFTVAMLIIFILMFNRWSRASEGVTYA